MKIPQRDSLNKFGYNIRSFPAVTVYTVKPYLNNQNRSAHKNDIAIRKEFPLYPKTDVVSALSLALQVSRNTIIIFTSHFPLLGTYHGAHIFMGLISFITFGNEDSIFKFLTSYFLIDIRVFNFLKYYLLYSKLIHKNSYFWDLKNTVV